MQAVETFQTEGLVAERLRPEHLGELLLMNRDPRIMATLGGVRPDEETERYLDDNLGHWERYGFGIWAFRDGRDGRFLARAGLRHTHVAGDDEVELAYALRSEYWGRGWRPGWPGRPWPWGSSGSACRRACASTWRRGG